MSVEINIFHEYCIQPLINEWITLRETRLTEIELKTKLEKTYKTVVDFVLFVKNCGFVNEFVHLVNNSINETGKLKLALNEQMLENDLKQLIFGAHSAFYDLRYFSKHYYEDMKPFKMLLKQRKKELLATLEDCTKTFPSLNLVCANSINEVNAKQVSLYTFAPIMATSLATAGFAATHVLPMLGPLTSCEVIGLSLTLIAAYQMLKNGYIEKDCFTQRDLNLIGLKQSARVLNNLVIVLREKMIYEEDFGKHSRIFSKTVRLIEDELNKLSDLMLFKVKNEYESYESKIKQN